VLFGRLRGDADRWQLDARLTLPGQEDTVWSARGTSAQVAFDAAFDRVGALLAPAQVLPQGPPAPVQISVEGVDDMAAYGRVWDHLAAVPGVQGLRPLLLGSSRAVFGFELPGGQAAIAGAVEPGAPFARAVDSPDYRYQP
jgi:hypothetical protein